MRDSPFIVGGDFNMNPGMLEESGFLEMAGCALLAPPSGLGAWDDIIHRLLPGRQVAGGWSEDG
eukprot:5441054-Heterocapsa_arctica.AAC.1